jgi:hypothetical protein
MSKGFSKAVLENSYMSKGVKMSQTTKGEDLRNLEYRTELTNGSVAMADLMPKLMLMTYRYAYMTYL